MVFQIRNTISDHSQFFGVRTKSELNKEMI